MLSAGQRAKLNCGTPQADIGKNAASGVGGQNTIFGDLCIRHRLILLSTSARVVPVVNSMLKDMETARILVLLSLENFRLLVSALHCTHYWRRAVGGSGSTVATAGPQ